MPNMYFLRFIRLPFVHLETRVQRYTKKMTLANKSAIFCIFIAFRLFTLFLGARLRMSIMDFPWIVVSFYITVQVL